MEEIRNERREKKKYRASVGSGVWRYCETAEIYNRNSSKIESSEITISGMKNGGVSFHRPRFTPGYD